MTTLYERQSRMNPKTKGDGTGPGQIGDDPRQAIESGEPTIEGRQPGRPDDEERNVEGMDTDPSRRRGDDARQGQDWESGRQEAI